MPQITEVSLEFMRRIQVRDYEPAESKIGFKATLLEGEDPVAAVRYLRDFASSEVHTVLGLPSSTALPVKPSVAVGTQTIKYENVGPTEKHPASVEIPSDIPSSVAAPATAVKTEISAVADLPTKDTEVAAPVATAKTQDSSSPVSSPATGVVTEASPAISTSAELSKWIGEQVRSGKVSSDDVKKLYPKFGVTRFLDITKDQVPAVAAEVSRLIQSVANNAESPVVMA